MNHRNKSLVFFGDSLLGRFGRTLIGELEGQLENVTVYNCAAGGWTTEDGLRRAAFIAQLKPDYLVLSFGANDAAQWKKQVPLDEFRSNYDAIIKAFPRSKVIVFLCPPGHDPSDPDIEPFNKYLVEYNKAARSISEANKVQWLDSPSVYGNLLKSGHDYHYGDGIHLNEDAYKVFIKELVRLVQED